MSVGQRLTVPERRERNFATLNEYYVRLGHLDIDSWIEFWADDCVQLMPFAAAGLPGRVEGREEVRRIYQEMADGYRSLSFSDIRISPLEDPDRVVVQWNPCAVTKAGQEYGNSNIALFTFDRDGRIIEFIEYFDPCRFVGDFDLGKEGV